METNEDNNKPESKPAFKKPILIGKIGRLPRKVNTQIVEKAILLPEKTVESTSVINETDNVDIENEVTSKFSINVQQADEKSVVLSYKEPPWSGLPERLDIEYQFEVLKSGSIIETINLMNKPFWVFGRLPDCDISMQHPTVSRYHAVLQYRSEITENQEPGFYLYDLNSTHGTFLNKNRLKPKVYARVYVGHMIKLGCSTRTYILTGPQDDVENETELSVTELKKQRAEELLKREEMALKEKAEAEERLKKEEERGVDWGMGDDADDETDLSENPFAQTNNEELYIDDPKKALRGFMEREGISWEYDCSEQGMGQFLCKVMLPIDDDKGRPIVAEVLHKGKKKEAVVQCALEACRILDRYGLLRQAVHESRKRKAKNWEENDYYDSDEDTFLDRTGTIEKKRENRMKAKVSQQPETYDSLLEKEKEISMSIESIEKQLYETMANKQSSSSTLEEDPLDSFMKELKQARLDKPKISKLKSELSKLKHEHLTVIKLINITKPAELPPLKPQYETEKSGEAKTKALPIFGKRLKVKVQLPARPSAENFDDEQAEEDDCDDVTETEQQLKEKLDAKKIRIMNVLDLENTLKPIEALQFASGYLEKLKNATSAFKNFTIVENRGNLDWKLVSVKVNKILHLIENNEEQKNNELLCVLDEIVDIFEQEVEVLKIKIKSKKSALVNTDQTRSNSDEINSALCNTIEEISEEELERRKKKNQRRIQQRQERSEIEKQKGYKEDAMKEDYTMWVPPEGQSGDGKTSLNEKFGY